MIRVGTLTDASLVDESYRENKTGMTAKEQLREIFLAVAPLYTVREQAFFSVMDRLARHGVQMPRIEDLDQGEKKALRRYFTQDIMPLLSPQIIDPVHPFPHLSNKQLHIAVAIEKKKSMLYGLIAVPDELNRLIPLEGDDCRFVLVEDLIHFFANEAFGSYQVLESNILAVTRNADISAEEDLLDEDIDYRQHMKNLLKKRQRLSPVRLEMVYPPSKEFLDFFCKKLSLSSMQVFCSPVPLDLSFCFSMDHIISPDALRSMIWPAHVPVETLSPEQKRNMIKTVSGEDILLSYPYESISPFLELIRQAAEEDTVVSIKVTLYRIDVQSRLAESLIRAAENGKEVVVLMELRARFDEDNNIEWAHRLEEVGCRVIYGLLGYKVHSKICLITRREYGSIQYITQIGTGNYNEKTARQYTDLSLITANQEIGRDAAEYFANVMIGNLDGQYQHLLVVPHGLKNNILASIDAEIAKAAVGAEGSILVKCNSMTDKEILDKLIEASIAGVHITMIIRGICCLTPLVPGLSDNIHVISIIGKFLEHARVFCFGTGSQRRMYISSADLMTRNTERRLEIACPILDPQLQERIMHMLETMLLDNTQAWDQFADGRYVSRHPQGEDMLINSQEMQIQEAQERAMHLENKLLEPKSRLRTTIRTGIHASIPSSIWDQGKYRFVSFFHKVVALIPPEYRSAISTKKPKSI